MKRLTTPILLIVLLLLIISTGFYFRNDFVDFYTKNAKSFEKGDFGTIIEQVKQEVFAPSPLTIRGEANNAVLVKSKIIAQTNVQRYNNGTLPPLIENPQLASAAFAKATDMFLNQYFEHVSPSGAGPGELVKNHGYAYIVSGENLILGNFKDEADLVQRWMDSPGHRDNILNDRFTEIGVAVVKGLYEGKIAWIGVQEFGLPLSACQTPDESLKQQIDANKASLEGLAPKIEAKKDEINHTNPRSPEYNQKVDQYNGMVEQFNVLNQATKDLVNKYNGQVSVFNKCVAPKQWSRTKAGGSSAFAKRSCLLDRDGSITSTNQIST